MDPVPVTAAMAPEWARGLSADEYDDGEEDGGDLEDMTRRPRCGRRRRRQVRRG